MYVSLHYNKIMRHALRYHEDKIKKGHAACILAENFLKDADKLSHKDKLAHFNRVNSLNAQVKKNTVHVTINFHPSEHPSDALMTDIAKAYMKKIGFDQQPYVGFRHDDAAHPHIHVVSTHIQRDGSRIDLRDILYGRSQQAQAEIQREFDLPLMASRTHEQTQAPGPAQKVVYGEATVKEAIQNVLYSVINDYIFSSLEEYNAILKQYNVRADRGREGNKMYKRRGLIYFALDDNGNTRGLPINASNFFFKPTLRNLEKKFLENEPLREGHSQRVKTAVDWTLTKGSSDQEDFKKAMEREGIDIELRRDKDGVVQGIFYIDHQKRVVWDGAALGDNYQPQAINDSFVKKQDQSPSEEQALRQRYRPNLF
jgi:Relaxase/Mobilisation nuclease domain